MKKVPLSHGFTLSRGRGRRPLIAPDGRSLVGAFQSATDAEAAIQRACLRGAPRADCTDLAWWLPELPELVDESPELVDESRTSVVSHTEHVLEEAPE